MAQASIGGFGYFGKLPSRGDFVRYSAGENIRTMDRWIQAGIQIARIRNARDFASAYNAGSVHQFFFYPEDLTEPLVGAIKPSHDAAGHSYPFFVSGNLRLPSDADGRWAEWPMRLQPFFELAVTLVNQACDGGQTAQEITEQLRSQPDVDVSSGPSSMGYTEELRRLNFSEVCTRLWDASSNGRKYIVFRNLRDVFLPFRDQESPRLDYGLVFPVPAGDGWTSTIGFWLDACQRLLAGASLRPSLVLYADRPASEAPSSLYLGVGKLPASSFLHLVGLDQDDDDTFRLDGGDGPMADVSLPDSIRSVLSSESASLWDVLQSLS